MKIIKPTQKDIDSLSTQHPTFTGLLDAQGQPIMRTDDPEPYSVIDMVKTENGLYVPQEDVIDYQLPQKEEEEEPWPSGKVAKVAALGGLALLAGCATTSLADQCTLTPVNQDTNADQNQVVQPDTNAAPVAVAPAPKSNLVAQTGDNKNFNGLYSTRNPSFLELGEAVTQLHNNQFLRGRWMQPAGRLISEFAFNLNAGGNYFRGQNGEYQVPFAASLSEAVLLNLDNNDTKVGFTLPRRLAALGPFGEFNYVDFRHAFTQDQYEANVGGELLAIQDAVQIRIKGGAMEKKMDLRYGLEGRLNGGFMDVMASLDLGYGILPAISFGFSDGHGKIRGNNNVDIDCDSNLSYLGAALGYSPTEFAQLQAYLTHSVSKNSYSGSSLQDVDKNVTEFGAGLRLFPARLFSQRKVGGLFEPTDTYFFLTFSDRVDPTSMYRKHDLGCFGGIGHSF